MKTVLPTGLVWSPVNLQFTCGVEEEVAGLSSCWLGLGLDILEVPLFCSVPHCTGRGRLMLGFRGVGCSLSFVFPSLVFFFFLLFWCCSAFHHGCCSLVLIWWFGEGGGPLRHCSGDQRLLLALVSLLLGLRGLYGVLRNRTWVCRVKCPSCCSISSPLLSSLPPPSFSFLSFV